MLTSVTAVVHSERMSSVNAGRILLPGGFNKTLAPFDRITTPSLSIEDEEREGEVEGEEGEEGDPSGLLCTLLRTTPQPHSRASPWGVKRDPFERLRTRRVER
jgi:hypothetical protein